MPKPVHMCDICDFKATNGYIFKRHLHRCLSLHGIASKRSSPRNPIRLKGTEGLLSKEGSHHDSNGSGVGLEQVQDDSNLELSVSEMDEETEKEDLHNSVDYEETESNPSTQWGVTDSVQVSSRRASVDRRRSSVTENATVSDDSPMPGAPYSRLYSCNECTFECKSARDHLHHLRNVHGNKLKIYECKICDYASRYNNKVERHMSVHSKLGINLDDQGNREKYIKEVPYQSLLGKQKGTTGHDTAEEDSESLKVKPLKLKRLSVKMPTFKVSGPLKLIPGSSLSDRKRIHSGAKIRRVKTKLKGVGLSKEMYRMVLLEDGSPQYQCRDCLYYAPIPSSVKKHHLLCHGRLLTCPHCDMNTASQGIFYEHLMTHKGHGYVKCPECSYVTNARSNFEKHRSFHGGNFPYNCSVCSFGSDSESKIKRHVAMQHTPDIGRTTDTGEMTAAQEEALDISNEDEPEREEKPMKMGNVSLKRYFAVKEKGKGPGGASSSKASDGESNHTEYKCPKCPMVCYRRGNFTRHLTAKHKYNQTNAALVSKNMESQIFRGLKKKGGPTSFGLKQMRFQSSEGLKCNLCSYIAKWPSDLRRHLQVHTIVKRFKCTICANKYKYLGDLNVHMRRDHNMEPPEIATKEITSAEIVKKASPAVFRCPICVFSSQSKAELEQHSRQHGDIDKTYKCLLCDYQTYWRGDVGRHLFRHHKIILSKEASEMNDYFLTRPEIKPLTKQTPPGGSRNSSLSPSPSPDTAKGSYTVQDASEFLYTGASDGSLKAKGSARNNSAPSPVFLKEGAFVCEFPNCDFKTTISDRMETHMAVHLNLKQFVCPTCGKRTNWKWDVVKHMNKVHMNSAAAIEDVITLSIDEAKATINDYLINFDKKSKEMTVNFCSLCDFKSLEKNRVVRHMGTVHKNENGKVISQTVANPEEFEPSLLPEKEKKLSAENERRASAESTLEEKTVSKFVDPTHEELAKLEKPYACAICKKSGSSRGSIKKHYNYSHPYKDIRIIYMGDGTEFNYYSGEIYKSSKIELSPDNDDAKSDTSSSSSLWSTKRPDSKFSNPKMHGYVKPFKCSICGLRSNWKWDLKKHLRVKHPGQGGFVIMLSIEEASNTYGTDCSPSHPKKGEFLAVSKSLESPLQTLGQSPNAVSDQHLFKSPPNIKAEALDNSDDDESQDELLSSSGFFPQSPASSRSPKPRSKGRDRSTFLDPTRPQWKCSGCNYISNWRRNMARHIHRKHPGQEGRIKVLPLHKANYKATSHQFMYDEKTNSDMEDSSHDGSEFTEEDRPVKKSVSLKSEPKIWNCSRCPFQSQLRTHIIIHMQQHAIKPFVCGVCNIPFMNRGPLHRHLQKVHRRSDYLKLCKVNIRFDDEGDENKGQYLNSFFCRLCNLESYDRQKIVMHLEEAHKTADNDNNILKIQKHIGGPPGKKSSLSSKRERIGSRKLHFCQVCPYRSQKKSMLAFHMTYHKPSPVNRYKCKYCPYYVSALRLLHQHQKKWHKDSNNKTVWEPQPQATPPTSPAKSHLAASPAGTPRRHSCEKCPYTTNSKNDFIYHKQFHRPKRTAEFKCEYCDYWVVHKRLLKQHMRLHIGAASPGVSADISPAKSVYSDPGLVYDPVELTELASIKQKMISAKITASLSKSPNVSPMKIASQCSVDDTPDYVLKNGLYRKVHKCRFCPYTNIRARNMSLHEMMHGPRDSNHPLMKCPYCDYYVGSKGLLSHHMKVHLKNYGDTPENDAEMMDTLDNGEESDQEIPSQQKVDTLLQISRFKRFGCERCPYASAKRQHFERHLELHGSRQRYTCQYCDYSVPSNNLLLQHTKLHLMPNQNLLASQSITNLQHLSEVPADVALASALPPADTDTTVTISVIHDHLGLYENSIYDNEPKKLYRCDRCPYANVRRDYLLSHLKFHMVPSALVCPYCDYSAPKQPLLTQHIRVHFCPLPELSEWLLENGQTERATTQKNIDLAEALKVAHEYQNQSKKKDKGKSVATNGEKAPVKDEKSEGKENIQTAGTDSALTYVCQYCEREFSTSEKLVKHELQHLIGNHFERTEYMCRNKKKVEQASMQVLADLQAKRDAQQQLGEHSNSNQRPEGTKTRKTGEVAEKRPEVVDKETESKSPEDSIVPEREGEGNAKEPDNSGDKASTDNVEGTDACSTEGEQILSSDKIDKNICLSDVDKDVEAQTSCDKTIESTNVNIEKVSLIKEITDISEGKENEDTEATNNKDVASTEAPNKGESSPVASPTDEITELVETITALNGKKEEKMVEDSDNEKEKTEENLAKDEDKIKLEEVEKMLEVEEKVEHVENEEEEGNVEESVEEDEPMEVDDDKSNLDLERDTSVTKISNEDDESLEKKNISNEDNKSLEKTSEVEDKVSVSEDDVGGKIDSPSGKDESQTDTEVKDDNMENDFGLLDEENDSKEKSITDQEKNSDLVDNDELLKEEEKLLKDDEDDDEATDIEGQDMEIDNAE